MPGENHSHLQNSSIPLTNSFSNDQKLHKVLEG